MRDAPGSGLLVNGGSVKGRGWCSIDAARAQPHFHGRMATTSARIGTAQQLMRALFGHSVVLAGDHLGHDNVVGAIEEVTAIYGHKRAPLWRGIIPTSRARLMGFGIALRHGAHLLAESRYHSADSLRLPGRKFNLIYISSASDLGVSRSGRPRPPCLRLIPRADTVEGRPDGHGGQDYVAH